MNQKQEFDDVVARWLDDGPDVAPERFVWAALEEVEHTPQRGAWRVALENIPMYTKLSIPVLAAAAVLVIAVALGFIGSPSNIGDGSPSPSATGAAPTAVPSASPEACGVAPATGGGLHVVWCVTGDGPVVVDFTFDAPVEWADQVFAGTQALYLVPLDGYRIAISRNGPETIDAWRDELLATAEFEVTEPEPITIDGIDGYLFDIRIAEGVDPASAPPVFEDSELDFAVGDGSTARVWLVAYPDRALAVVTRAPDSEVEAWIGSVSDAIETIEWGQ